MFFRVLSVSATPAGRGNTATSWQTQPTSSQLQPPSVPVMATSECGRIICLKKKLCPSVPLYSVFNLCSVPRCLKGACVALDARTYRCDCEDQYSGALCNLKAESAAVSACRGVKCLRGQCEQTEDGGRCVCEPGFTGESCDIGEHGGHFQSSCSTRQL